MFRRHKRRHTNIVFVIFRLLLSFVIFVALLAGILSAYKHFSGLDALNLSPKSIANVFFGFVSQQNLFQNLPKQINENILGQAKNTLEPGKKSVVDDKKENGKQSESRSSTSKFMFRFALLADSHSDNVSLKKALEQVKKDYSDTRFIIGLGDYTDVGTLDELRKVKNELDSSGFRYFVTVGDHDIWDSRNKSLVPAQNFSQVFGPTYQSFIHENFLFLLLYNSDNYLGLDDGQKNWLSNQLNANKQVSGIFIFLHEPLFHPSSDHFMGRVEEKLRLEAQNLVKQLAESKVKKVFAADTHFFSEYTDPQSNLPMVTIGAITSQRNLQNPRFAIVSVFEDGETKIEDVEVK